MGFSINRVYTRSGDSGQTGLLGSKRVSKSDIHIEVIGNLDELNACLGLLRDSLSETLRSSYVDSIQKIQQSVFNIGAEIAACGDSKKIESVSPDDIKFLEVLCDDLGEGLPELKSFILPGGTTSCSYAHLARAVTRRAERSLVALVESTNGSYELNPNILVYVNRLSDVLFNFSRKILLDAGVEAPLWEK